VDIVIVTNSLTGGGAERAMNLLANELTRRGHKVTLIPINDGPSDSVALECQIISLHRKWKSGLVDLLIAIKNFRSTINLINPDVILLNCDLPELLGVFVPIKRKLVGIEHSSHPWSERRLLGRLVRLLLTMKKIRWVAVSNHLTIWPTSKKPNAVHLNIVIPNIQDYSPKFELHNRSSIKRLVFIGRLDANKRAKWAIEIANLAEIPLEIFGNGPELFELQELSYKYQSQVKFNGFMPDVWDQIQTGDLLIVSSALEGDGLVVIESLYYGTPFLLADNPDFRRFDFPEKVYCADIEEFVVRVMRSKTALEQLLVPQETRISILSERKEEKIGASWERYLTKILEES
jgi:glycosyltransferase involved in cell wall biosynthesis